MINHEAVDVVIVGAGAAGSQLAVKLARGGKRVVVLEAGPPWQLRDMFSSQIWARRLKWASGPSEHGRSRSGPCHFQLGRRSGWQRDSSLRQLVSAAYRRFQGKDFIRAKPRLAYHLRRSSSVLR